MIFIFLAKIFSQHSWLIFSVLDFIFFYKINCLASSNVSPQSFRLPYLNSLFLPYVFICFTFLCWYFRCCQNYFGPYFCLFAFLNIFLEWLICFRIYLFIYLFAFSMLHFLSLWFGTLCCSEVIWSYQIFPVSVPGVSLDNVVSVFFNTLFAHGDGKMMS